MTEGFAETDRHESREIHNRICDTSLRKSTLGFEPKVSLSAGLEELYRLDYLQKLERI